MRGNTTSTLVQIDHVVALENAWRTGAQQLSQEQREALANDPMNLFAVDGHSNAQKRSGDAATWLPADTAFRCTYVEHQIAVKTTYRLWVAPAEHDAMERVLSRC
nr:HNH endonuclease family protein [Curtobacterium oceanosedimentum]